MRVAFQQTHINDHHLGATFGVLACPVVAGCVCMRRLQQLRQESGRNKRKCAELEALIGRASTVMDQLAANCDL